MHMTAAQAYDHLHTNVYQPVFFNKLANEYDIRPRNAQDAERLLGMAGKLRVAYDNGVAKQASYGNDLLAAAEQTLDGLLGKSAGSSDEERSIQQAVVELSKQANYREAVLTFQNAAAAGAI